MKNKIKYLILILVVFALLSPKPARADFLGIMDFFAAVQGGIEELSKATSELIFNFFLAFIAAISILYASAFLLQYSMENFHFFTLKADWILAGWHFTSGIANMMIVLILVVIALAFILKLENLQMQKALPKLIIIALLINFSLVFIGIFIDIANIFTNTILSASGGSGVSGLPFQVIDSIGLGAAQLIGNLLTWLGALAVGYAIPFTSGFAQFAVVMIVLGLGFLPNLVTWVFQLFFMNLLSGIFFTFAFLFAVRVFMIQLLAILAPIAIVCLILPQTEKHWNEWFKNLMEWITFGIILLLFLVIGLRGSTEMMSYLPLASATPIPFISWLSLPNYLFFYLFVFTYLVTALWISKKYSPEIAHTMMQQANVLGGMMKQRLGPLGKAFRKGFTEKWGERRRETFAGAAVEERVGAAKGFRGWYGKRYRTWAQRVHGVTPELMLSKATETEAKQLEDTFGDHVDEALKVRPFNKLTAEGKAAMGLYLTKMKGTAGFDKVGDIEQKREVIEALDKYNPDKVAYVAKYKEELAKDEKVGEIIRSRVASKGLEEDIVKEMYRRNDTVGTTTTREIVDWIKKFGFDDPTIQRDYTQLIIQATEAKLSQSSKSDDVDKITRQEALTNLESMIRYSRPEVHRKLLDTQKLDWNEFYEKVIKDIGIEEVAKTAPQILAFPYTSGGRAMGARTFEDFKDIENIRDKIKEVRKGITLSKEEVEEIFKEVIKKKEEIEKVVVEKPVKKTKVELSKERKKSLGEKAAKAEEESKRNP